MSTSTQDTQQKDLHNKIWKIANELRGSLDGWDFKQYVLGILFYRFISENLAAYIQQQEENINYQDMQDKDAEYGKETLIEEKGFFIKPSDLFINVKNNAKLDENLNETLKKVFQNIEGSAQGTTSEANFKGLFDDIDLNSNKLGSTVTERNQKLTKLLNSVAELEFKSDYTKNSIDLFGDAYEFLMQMYAANAGKSGGEYFTPQEVSELLAEITTLDNPKINKVYDPACGSGSLLLKFSKILNKVPIEGFFGQEINLTTYNLCRMNMFLHNINYNKFNIKHGNTLTEPKHQNDEPFDAIVSNPPYSIRWEGSSSKSLIDDERFTKAGILAPQSKADLAFVMHSLSYLSPKGTAAIVSFPGVMYRGGAEQKIREYLIKENYINAVIQLPTDLFFGTSIATCILVLKKNKSNDNNILFIDATQEFTRGQAKNKLSSKNIQTILDYYKNRQNIPHICALIKNQDVIAKDSNLSVNSYVEQKNTKEEIDIKKLNAEITEIVNKQTELRFKIDEIIKELEQEQNEPSTAK